MTWAVWHAIALQQQQMQRRLLLYCQNWASRKGLVKKGMRPWVNGKTEDETHARHSSI
jgi:hypothetical protein